MTIAIKSAKKITLTEWNDPARHVPMPPFLYAQMVPYNCRIFETWFYALCRKDHLYRFFVRRRCLFTEKKFSEIVFNKIQFPVRTDGGWISEKPLSSEHAAVMKDHIIGSDAVMWRENPYDPSLSAVEIPGAVEDFTSSIDLSLSDKELFDASDYSHHKALRRANDAGLAVRTAESLDEWKQYYDVYLDSVRRWSSQGQPENQKQMYKWDLFELLHNEKENVKLWVALKDNRIVAGIVCFYWNYFTTAWHGAALESFFQFRPNNLLYWTAVLDARNHGFRWFDCNPSGGHEGVARFKEHLGARKLRSRTFIKMAGAAGSINRIKKLFDLKRL